MSIIDKKNSKYQIREIDGTMTRAKKSQGSKTVKHNYTWRKAP